MPIITNSTFSLLVKTSSGKISREKYVNDLEFFLKNIFKNKILFYIFNFYERKKLFTAKYLLENEKKFIEEFFEPLESRIDEMSLVYSRGGKYKYHLYNSCKAISNEYIDFVIPQEITDLGIEKVNFFRKWFEDRDYKTQYLKTKNKDAINARIQVAYNSVFPKLFDLNKVQEDYDFIRERVNSGDKTISETFDLTSNRNELTILVNERKNLINNNDVRLKMANYDFLLFKDDIFIVNYLELKFGFDICSSYGLNNIKSFWRKHKNIKDKIYDNLIDYFKWTYNFQGKEFADADLDKLGFECCKFCLKQKSNYTLRDNHPS